MNKAVDHLIVYNIVLCGKLVPHQDQSPKVASPRERGIHLETPSEGPAFDRRKILPADMGLLEKYYVGLPNNFTQKDELSPPLLLVIYPKTKAVPGRDSVKMDHPWGQSSMSRAGSGG